MSPTLDSERIELVADPYALYELSLEQGWGDGLPLLPPTEERVAELLEGTPYGPAHTIVEEMHPAGGPATIEKIAVNAAMTGCRPEHLPFVIAGVEAICQPGYNLYGVGATTGSAFQMLMVNGPSRDRVGIDYSYGCMGGATGRGSRTIGRAVALCLRNIGGQRAGLTTKSCFGQPARLGMCFGEWRKLPVAVDGRATGLRQGSGRGPRLRRHGHHAAVRQQARERPRLGGPGGPEHRLPGGQQDAGQRHHDAHQPGRAGHQPRLGGPLRPGVPRRRGLQGLLVGDAWQPIDLWPESTRHLFEERARDGQGLPERTAEQFVVLVCGGPVSLHAVYLPSWGENELQSRAVVHPDA